MDALLDHLLVYGPVPVEELRRAADHAEASGVPLASVLLDLGLLDERGLAAAAAAQAGLPFADLATSPADPRAAEVLPPGEAERLGVLPVAVRDGALVVAVADPAALPLADEVARLSGRRVEPALAARGALDDAIGRYVRAARLVERQEPAPEPAVGAAPSGAPAPPAAGPDRGARDAGHGHRAARGDARGGRLRPPPVGRGEAGRARPRTVGAARALPGAGARRDPGDGLLDPDPAPAREAGGRARARLRPHPARPGPLPAQRLPSAGLRRRRVPAHPGRHQAPRGPRDPAPGGQPRPPVPRVRAGHRADRVGQVDHPGLPGGPGQPGALRPHHDRRRPDRVPPHPQTLPGQPARGGGGTPARSPRPSSTSWARTPTSSWSGRCATSRRSRSR